MSKDSDQRAGAGSGIVVLPARCMPFTVASGPGSTRMNFRPDPPPGFRGKRPAPRQRVAKLVPAPAIIAAWHAHHDNAQRWD